MNASPRSPFLAGLSLAARSPAALRMTALLHRGLTWAAVTKALALFLLPLPLLVVVLAALIAGDVERLALAAAALGTLWGSGVMVVRGLVAEARYVLGDRSDLPVVPLKALSTLLTAAGATLAGFAGGHELLGACVFGALGAAGHLLFYGKDIRPRRISVAVVEGVDRAAVTLQLQQAYARIRGIEAASREIKVSEFCERLARITGIGRSILAEIERDPSDAPRARRFLNIYLDSAERVTQEYARTHRGMRSMPLEQNFRKLLVDMETSFAEQHRKLLEHDLLSLDVDIEVLNERLKREGLG